MRDEIDGLVRAQGSEPRHAHHRPTPGPTEVYAALWLGALLIASGAVIDPLPAEIEELARRYFEAYPPHAKA